MPFLPRLDGPATRSIAAAFLSVLGSFSGPSFGLANFNETSLAPTSGSGSEKRAEEYDANRFEKKDVATNLIQPMALAIAPDQMIYLIELAGEVKRIDPKSKQVDSIGKLKVTTAQENGLIGIALDPNFEANQWMYLQYSPPDFSGQHVSRFTLKDGKLDLESEKVLFKYEEQRQECCHHAGSLQFGNDGCLYIGTGDNTNPFGDSGGYAPIDEREGRAVFNALRTSSNTKNYNGKVLRIKPTPEGGYTIPDGNLFSKDGAIGHPEIYVMGCRNPWRIHIDRKTGYLYWGDVGPDAGGDGVRGPRGYDEVNQAKQAGYFGWPLFIANNQPYVRYDFADKKEGSAFDPSAPINESAFNTGAKELPPAQPAWIYYPAGASKEFPELGSGGRTACAGPAYDFDPNSKSERRFPEHFHRSLFIYEWSRNWIAAVHLNEDSSIRSIEPFLPQIPFTRPIDMEFDREGTLYVIEYGETWGTNPDAKLVRLEYVRGNRAPSAQLQSDKIAGREPLTLHFTSHGTTDKDGDALSYRWTVSQASTPANASNSQTPPAAKTNAESVIGTTPDVEWTATAKGVYNIRLDVTDSQQATSSATLTVFAGNAIPEVLFARPQHGDFYDLGKEIGYKVDVIDLEDGTTSEDIADQRDMEFIDATAPSRVSVQASLVSPSAKEDPANVPNGLKRMRGSDCFNCHAMETPLVGPSFLAVADKYRDQKDAMKASIERVQKGSTGVWGKVAMLPHSQHSESEIREMVEFVYAVKPNPSAEYRTGMANAIHLLEGKNDFAGTLKITANYLDLGREDLPALTGSKSIELRSRTFQAEQADAPNDMKVLGSHKSVNGKFLGSINHGSYFRVADVPLDQFQSITASVTSAGAGGAIEVRLGKADGPVLGTMEVKVNGDWDGWYDTSTDCRLPTTVKPTDRADIYFVFVNEKNRGGLMNIDWVRFNKPE